MRKSLRKFLQIKRWRPSTRWAWPWTKGVGVEFDTPQTPFVSFAFSGGINGRQKVIAESEHSMSHGGLTNIPALNRGE
jgi:hypothetical protein